MNRRVTLEKLQRDAIEWLKLLLALVVIAALVAVDLMIDHGPTPVRSLIIGLIPNFIATVAVFPIVYLLLRRVTQADEQRLEQLIERATAAHPARTFKDVAGFAETVTELVRRAPKGEVRLEILAYTGATFTTALLRDLIESFPNRLHLIVRLIDFARADRNILPSHWESEASETLRRLPVLSAGKAKLEIWGYAQTPFVLGILVNDTDLLVGFPEWASGTEKLSDRSVNYHYFAKGPGSEMVHSLFRNWAAQPRQTALKV